MTIDDIAERWRRARLAGERVDSDGQRWMTVEVPCDDDPREDVRELHSSAACWMELGDKPVDYVTNAGVDVALVKEARAALEALGPRKQAEYGLSRPFVDDQPEPPKRKRVFSDPRPKRKRGEE